MKKIISILSILVVILSFLLVSQSLINQNFPQKDIYWYDSMTGTFRIVPAGFFSKSNHMITWMFKDDMNKMEFEQNYTIFSMKLKQMQEAYRQYQQEGKR